MKNLLIILAIAVAAWLFFHHPRAHWQGQLAPENPYQDSDHLPPPWSYKSFTVIARAQYHIKAVVLSKYHYWGITRQDSLSSYDLALGWGAMSDGNIINQLNISQGGRWYRYSWRKVPHVDQYVVITNSSNHHIIAGNQEVLEAVQDFKRYDVVELEGYIVDIQSNKDNWTWSTSVSRFDTGNGACKVFWVTNAFSIQQ